MSNLETFDPRLARKLEHRAEAKAALIKLYEEKKGQVTLDGHRAIITKLNSKFPLVSVASGGYDIEFSRTAIERILNNNCEFRS